MADIDYQKIFDELQNILPADWDRVAFYAEYTEGSYSMKYYVKKDGKYTDCFELANTPKGNIIKTFMSIDKIIGPIRSGMKDKWNVMTLVVDKEGTFKVDFDYSDVEGQTISYHESWEKKYLI